MRKQLPHILIQYSYILFLFSFNGCIGLAVDKPIIGKYCLVATDVPQDLTLSYQLENESYVGVVSKTVFAIGFNSKYIIVKQHPKDSSGVMNKRVTNYFIASVVVQNPLWPERDVIGPFSLNQFEQKRKELNIENIDFTIVYEDLQ